MAVKEMDKDIVPELLETISKEFDHLILESTELKQILKKLSLDNATYVDANAFAIEVGEILTQVLQKHLSADVLPNRKMYYNIAERIFNETLSKNYDLISGYTADVQRILNANAGIGLKTKLPAVNQDRIDGIINRVSHSDDFEIVQWLIDSPIVNFSQSVVDDVLKENIDFHAKAGLSPEISRRPTGSACGWCMRIAGTYDYSDAPDDIYRRHSNCRCVVFYDPKSGKGLQNVHTKAWN